MKSVFITHPACIDHENSPNHAECPERLGAIIAELSKPEYKELKRYVAPKATIDQIARVHDRKYVENILARVPKAELGQVFIALDADTGLSPGSGEAALRAAGAVIAAVDEVLGGSSKNAFCGVRPPGHHAEYAKAMGFCLFNNVAIGAAHALEIHNLKRVAIIDFDVHHGNGTQDWAEKQNNVLFVSSHLFPFFPGTGAAGEKGPHNNIVNLPLEEGADSARFRALALQAMLPKIRDYKPEMIFISAGFDAHHRDPIGHMKLTEDDFGWITAELVKLAHDVCGGRIVSTLEGGYNLGALAASAGAHVRALMAG
jgi:acetoin utilization deacetylase AcuC-like enzyme